MYLYVNPFVCVARPHGTWYTLEGEGDGTVIKPFEVNCILFIFLHHVPYLGWQPDKLLSESLVSISLQQMFLHVNRASSDKPSSVKQ